MNRAKIISVNPIEPTLGSMYFVAEKVIPRHRILDEKYDTPTDRQIAVSKLMFPAEKARTSSFRHSVKALFTRLFNHRSTRK